MRKPVISLKRADPVLVRGRKNGNAANGAIRNRPAIVVDNPQRNHLFLIPKTSAERRTVVGIMSIEPK